MKNDTYATQSRRNQNMILRVLRGGQGLGQRSRKVSVGSGSVIVKCFEARKDFASSVIRNPEFGIRNQRWSLVPVRPVLRH
jgi:hypothetical protein